MDRSPSKKVPKQSSRLRAQRSSRRLLGRGRARAKHRGDYLFLLARVQLVERTLQLFELLSGLAELAFRRKALVVGKVFGGFRDEPIEITSGLRGRNGCRCASVRLGGNGRGSRRWGIRRRSTERRCSPAKKRRHRRLKRWPIREFVLQCEHHQPQ